MELDALIKRYFPVVLVTLTGGAAYFQASGVAQILGAAIAVDEKGLLASGGTPKSAGAAPTSDHHTTAASIIERNPFDSVKGNLNPAPSSNAASTGPALAATDDPYHAPPCEGVKLLATAVSDDAAWSFAFLTGGPGEGSASKLRRQADDHAGKKVWFIRPERVWLVGPGAFCQVEMYPTTPPKPGSSSSAPMPSVSATGGSGKSSGIQAEIASKIQRVSATEFNVDRSAIDKILENQNELIRSARVVPEQENGKTVGVRLFGVRPDSLLGSLGLENGDRLQTINGFDLSNPEKALGSTPTAEPPIA
ncbi:MAG: type II secretion system protein GspC [Polyangiaceae bacterium]